MYLQGKKSHKENAKRITDTVKCMRESSIFPCSPWLALGTLLSPEVPAVVVGVHWCEKKYIK